MKTVTDIYGKRHGIAIREHDGFKFSAIDSKSFGDTTSARSFLHSLGQTEEFWQRIVRSLPDRHPNSAITNSFELAASMLVTGKIAVIELRSPDLARQRGAIKTSDNKTIHLLSAAQAQLEAASAPQRFYSRSEAESYLDSLDLSQDSMDPLLPSSKNTTGGPSNNREALIDALLTGSIVAVEQKSAPLYVPKSEAVTESDVPGSRPVPAPPPAEAESSEPAPEKLASKDAEQAETLIEAAANGAAFCEDCDAA